MAISLKIVVPPHPLIAHWLTVLRSDQTPAPVYATGMEEIGRWLSYEALREWLPYRKEKVCASGCEVEGTVIESNIPLLSITIRPGGLELWQGARKVVPNARISIEGIPKNIERNAGVLVFIDQIASGDTLLKILQKLQKQEVQPERLRVISAIASSPGLQNIGGAIKELTIYTTCIDAELTEKGSICPGIGDPSLRLHTRIHSSN